MISAIILAAGLSKRMKIGNKLLLERNKIPIIKTTLDKIKASNVKDLILVLGNNAKPILNIIKNEKIKISYNKDYKSGVSSSIKKGIKELDNSSEGVIICLADMPSIKTSTYNKLISTYYENKNKNIVPYFRNQKGNPVLFSKSYFKSLMNIKGDVGAKNLIKDNKEDFLKIPVTDSGIIEDIDNEKQYLRYIKKKEDN